MTTNYSCFNPNTNTQVDLSTLFEPTTGGTITTNFTLSGGTDLGSIFAPLNSAGGSLTFNTNYLDSSNTDFNKLFSPLLFSITGTSGTTYNISKSYSNNKTTYTISFYDNCNITFTENIGNYIIVGNAIVVGGGQGGEASTNTVIPNVSGTLYCGSGGMGGEIQTGTLTIGPISYGITVGIGGTAGTSGVGGSGGSSSAFAITALGGGASGSSGASGGSGCILESVAISGGGGGGSYIWPTPSVTLYSTNGSSNLIDTNYGGGGGGGGYYSSSQSYGAGGIGGGGNGGISGTSQPSGSAGSPGITNLGGGGGGGGGYFYNNISFDPTIGSYNGGTGSNGVVILQFTYP